MSLTERVTSNPVTVTLRLLTVVGAVIVSVALAAVGESQERTKHSGTIVAIDHLAGTIVVGEVGPWKVRGGQTVVVNRTITLTPDTEVTIAGRTYDALDGWGGQFIEGPLGPDALYLNDHVTVDCLHVGARMIALKITITAPHD